MKHRKQWGSAGPCDQRRFRSEGSVKVTHPAIRLGDRARSKGWNARSGNVPSPRGAGVEGNLHRVDHDVGSARGAPGGHFFKASHAENPRSTARRGPGGRRTPPSVLTALD